MSLPSGSPSSGAGQRPPPLSGRHLEGRDVAITIGVLVGAFVLGQIVFAAVFGGSTPSSAADLRVRILFVLALSFVVLFAPVYVVMIRNKGYSWADLGVRPLSAHWRRVAVLAGIMAVPLMLLVVSFIQRHTGAGSQELVKALAGSGASFFTALTFFLYIALLVPIAEELLFRGLLFGWLRQSQSLLVTNLICAGAFALLHQQLVAVVVTFFLGLVFGMLRERSGTVLAPMIMHQAYNGVTLILTFGVAAMPNPAS